MKNRIPFSPATLSFSLALLLLAGCATRAPRHQRTAPSNGVGQQAPQPVMPPVYEGNRHATPGPQPVKFAEPLIQIDIQPAASTTRELQPRKGTSYTVKKGESLSAIAARNRMSWRELAEYNYITDPNKLRAGQVILIPSKGTPAPVSTGNQVAPPPAPPTASGNTYVVQSGDSLSVIARRYGSSVATLKSINGLSSDRLLVGQILKLPAGASADNSMARETTTPRPTPVPTRPLPTPVPEPDVLDFNPTAADRTTGVVEDAVVESEDPIVSKAFPIVVQEGDTLESISNDYIVTVEEIRKLNNLPPNTEVKVGQKLQIPPSVY